MPLPKPEPGLVIRYAYLWSDEFLAGREEGVKDRPCAIIAATAVDDEGRQRVLVLPVTHTMPVQEELALEIPSNVKRHIGLDDARSWIVVSESNEFLWPGPDLRRVKDGDESTVAFGFLPPKLFARVRLRFLKLEALRRARRVPRTE